MALTKQISHFGVYGVIEKNSQYLLIRKSRGPYKGLLDLPGGRPKPHEKYEETLKREVLEETKVLVKKVNLLKDFSFKVTYLNDFNQSIEMCHNGLIYRIVEYEDSNINLNLVHEDVLGAKWLDYRSINSTNCSQLVLEAFS